MDNKHLIPQRLWTLLVERIIKEWRMSRPLAERVMDQALGYLRLCASCPEVTFSPSPLVDIGWHVFILHTRAYMTFCDSVAGHYIHHTPYNEDEVDIAAADCGPCGPCHANEAGLDPGVNNIPRTTAAMRQLGITVDEALWPTGRHDRPRAVPLRALVALQVPPTPPASARNNSQPARNAERVGCC